MSKQPVTAAIFEFEDKASEKFLINIFIGDLLIVDISSGHESVLITVQGLTEDIDILKGMFKRNHTRNVKPVAMVG